MYSIRFPNFVLEVLKKIIAIAVFDIPYLDADTIFGGWLINLPENDSIDIIENKQNTEESYQKLEETFEALGYESRYLSRTMGSVYLVLIGIFFSLLTFIALKPFY